MRQKGVSNDYDPTAQKPKPPTGMCKQARAEWRRIVEQLPHDWFSIENLPLLRSYCEAAAEAQRIDELLKKHRDVGGSIADPAYRKLAQARTLMTKDLINVGRQLRFTQQSRWQPVTAARKTGTPRQDNVDLSGADRLSKAEDQPWSDNVLQ